MQIPKSLTVWLGFGSLFAGSLAQAAPQITEFVAINASSLTDGDGNSPDWIEIHNPDATPLELEGYHLTDDAEIPTRYTFPAGTTIPAGGYLVVFASGRPEANYSDAGGNLHTNFSLDGGGEYLALNAPDGSAIHAFAPAYPKQFEDTSYGVGTSAETTAIFTAGAPATWLVPGSDIGGSWQAPTFDDGAWASAETGIGYGYDDLVGAGGDTLSSMWFGNPSVYIRVPFEISDPATISTLSLDMRYEDGFVAYLNGTRVASANAPDEGSLTHTSTATLQHPNAQAVVPETFPLAPGSLVAGTNILAIHGLNFSSSGTDSSDFLALPELSAITSDATGAFGYFTTPSPGAANDPTPLEGFVADTKFSHDRGYYDAPFDLSITTTTPGATIIYTTDGTPPTEGNGTTYTEPITISSTATIRAFASKEEFQPTNIDTQTYLFIDDIVRQTRPAAYPTTWGGPAADYDMDADVVDDPDYADKFGEAFAALPTLSLVFDPDAFFDRTTGIYQNPGSAGAAWERPLSAEFFVPDGSEPGFQINAGVRIQGGSSRSTDTPKHSLSLRFRAEYGNEKLRYPLYENTPSGETALDRFDVLQLRPEYNHGWMHRHYFQAVYAQYGRDQWASDLFLAMGQNGSHGRWVHLYLNGLYWGVYDVHERPDADHMANYFGGEDDDYDTINSRVATNGDTVAYQNLVSTADNNRGSDATYQAVQGMLDVDAFIDYMILNAYVGNRDWDGHNWRAARKREAGAKFLFFPWDTEFSISHHGGGVPGNIPDYDGGLGIMLTTNVTSKNNNNNPTGIQGDLQLNAEYRLRYADHVRRHMFNGGPLTPDGAAAIWMRRATSMTTAVVAESARWGDHRRDQNPGRWTSGDFDLYTRDDHFLPMQQWIAETYFPQRTDIVLAQLRARGLYPDTDAPDFSQHGGTVPRGFMLQIVAPDTIHYTTDGSDPRLAGGDVNPGAASIAPGSEITLNQSTEVRARTRAAGGEWSALTAATFTIAATDLRITEIMYRPSNEPLAEFLELTNRGGFTVSLTGLHFTRGISFDFDQHSSIHSLAAGGRILIIRDLDAFRSVHGNAHDALIAGTFQDDSALANSGETLTIADADDTVVLTVTYNDKAPWPTSADGGGRSLVYSGGDPARAESWRPSAAADGNPGSSDSIPFAGGSLLDYVLAAPVLMSPTESGATLTYSTHLGADEATISVQHSLDLGSWETIPPAILSQQLDPGGTSRSITVQLPDGNWGFARLLVTSLAP